MNKRMARSVAVLAAIGAMVVTGAAQCAPPDSGPTSGHTAKAPSIPTIAKGQPTDCAWNVYDKACDTRTPQSVIGNGDPNALPDANPVPTPPKFGTLLINPSGGYNCHLYLNSLSGIIAHGGVLLGTIYGFCTVGQPATVTTMMYLQAWSPALGRFTPIFPTRQVVQTPPDPFPAVSKYHVAGHCGAGVEYRIYVRTYGTGKDGSSFGTATPNPNIVDMYTMLGKGIRFSGEQCVHGGGN